MKKPIPPTEVDSCDEIRKAMIERRNTSFKSWPDEIPDTILFSHVIAWLGYCEALQQWTETEQGAHLNLRHLAEEIYVEGQNRCAICFWTLAENTDKGCVRGNCSMRGESGEYERKSHRAKVEAIVGVLQKHFPELALASRPAEEEEQIHV